MELKYYIAAGILGIGAAVSAPFMLCTNSSQDECNGLVMNNECLDIGHSEVVGTYHGSQENLFVLFYENHIDLETQENAFLTLEELLHENNAGFVAMEYFDGEFSYDRMWERRRISFAQLKHFWRIADMPDDERRDYAARAMTDPELTAPAGAMFELVYQDSVVTFGMDDWQLRRKEGLFGGEWEDVMIVERSRAFIRNITDYIAEHPGTGRIISVSTGLWHRLSIEEELKKRGLSYVSLFPDGLEYSIHELFPEQRQRTFE
ncbi:MAG TPA: hypothetical protein HA362_03575 [Nanoarchaeota archaeon]|nr:hypothetical protein [Nanoarchaeota archaeon]